MKGRSCVRLFILLGLVSFLTGCNGWTSVPELSITRLELYEYRITALQLRNNSIDDFFIKSMTASLYDNNGSFLERQSALKGDDGFQPLQYEEYYYFPLFSYSFSYPSVVKKIRFYIYGNFENELTKDYYMTVTLPDSEITLHGDVKIYYDSNNRYHLTGDVINSGGTIIDNIYIRVKIYSDGNKQDLIYQTGEIKLPGIKPKETRSFDITTYTHYPVYHDFIINWDDRIKLESNNIQIEYN